MENRIYTDDDRSLEKYRIESSRDLSPDQFRRLVARRAREIIDPRIGPVETEEQRRELETKIEKHFEALNLGADFLPARFLLDGAQAAQAVCRIITGTSLGTGFLIAPGVIMTNNHVIPSLQEALRSNAEFGFEAEQTAFRVACEPRRLFITNVGLDFTIVAIEEAAVRDIEPLRLLRNPALVTRNDAVNIIQHPRGRPKEVALHNNKVVRVQNQVIRYETDTEPGSSGSPVFNNTWDLVALHHAGQTLPGGRAENEGIRIAAIVQRLLAEASQSSASSAAIRPLLESVTDTSPYLGFFDFHGTGFEVEVPDFAGTRDFADVGVWNIEHFNNQISDQRVEDVAEVVGKLAMDVLGLVEVERGALDRLLTALGQRGFSMGFNLLDTPGAQDIAVLFDKDTTEVRPRGDIAQRHMALLNARTANGQTVFPRFPLFVECTVGEAGHTVKFLMIVVHLKAFGDAQSRARRRLAAENLARIIEDTRERESMPVVLGGDFNEQLNTDVLAALKESPDLFSMTMDDATTDAISFVGDTNRSLIDHILVSRDVRLGQISGDDAAIVRLDRSVQDFAGRISDHVPVVFRMILREQPIDTPPPPQPQGVNVEIPAGSKRLRLQFEGD